MRIVHCVSSRLTWLFSGGSHIDCLRIRLQQLCLILLQLFKRMPMCASFFRSALPFHSILLARQISLDNFGLTQKLLVFYLWRNCGLLVVLRWWSITISLNNRLSRHWLRLSLKVVRTDPACLEFVVNRFDRAWGIRVMSCCTWCMGVSIPPYQRLILANRCLLLLLTILRLLHGAHRHCLKRIWGGWLSRHNLSICWLKSIFEASFSARQTLGLIRGWCRVVVW